MESIKKNLAKLNSLLKAIKQSNELKLPTIPSIKPPSPPSLAPTKSAAPKISSGAGPNSKKDPRKVAQQIKDGSMSTKTQKIMFKSHDSAQWNDKDIEKADAEANAKLYHIHDGPHRITTKPMSLREINTRHGGVKKLESSGLRLIAHDPKPSSSIKKDEDSEEEQGLEKAAPDFTLPKKITYDKPWVNPALPSVVHADYHGFGGEMNNVHESQKHLIHGLDISGGEDVDQDTATKGNKIIKNSLNGKKMIVKSAADAEGGMDTSPEHQKFMQDRLGMFAPDGLNAARREVLFHNVAHETGLGKYVPTTAGFTKNGKDYSAQEIVDGGISPNHILGDRQGQGKHKDRFHKTMKNLHDSGDLHKLAILDSLMGNEDRHGGNYLLHPKKQQIHLIDHGRAIDYKQLQGSRTPHYLQYAEKELGSDKIHPKALEWLNNLSEKDASNMLEKYVESDSRFKGHFLNRLANLKSMLNSKLHTTLSKDLKSIGKWQDRRNVESGQDATQQIVEPSVQTDSKKI